MTARPNSSELPPRITIVTPSFNQGKFLEETIRSVLDQAYPNLEYMIIDGASTDDSISVIRKYEKRLAYWTSEPDRGQADAINKGWRRATGEILAYLNSDDTYCPDALNRIGEAFRENPTAGLVFGRCYVIDDKSAVLRERYVRAVSFADMLCWSPSIPQPGTFFRRAAMEQAGFLNPSLHYTMDYDLCLKIGEKSEMVFLPQPIANLRDHPTAKTAVAPLEHIEEGIVVVRTFFSQTRLPEIAALEPRALAALHLRKARLQCRLGATAEARTTARQALRFRCNAVTLKEALVVLAMSLAGANIIAKLRTLKRNLLRSWRQLKP